jgi:hypothetical protein
MRSDFYVIYLVRWADVDFLWKIIPWLVGARWLVQIWMVADKSCEQDRYTDVLSFKMYLLFIVYVYFKALFHKNKILISLVFRHVHVSRAFY